MGYTHHYEVKGEIPIKAIEDIQKVIERYNSIIQREDDDNSPPLVSSELIVFNGIGEAGHETFAVAPNSKEFCKTSQKPYDLPVSEILLILKHHIGKKMELSSDGFWVSKEDLASWKFDGNWNQALINVKNEFGYEFEFMPQIHKGPYYSFELVGSKQTMNA